MVYAEAIEAARARMLIDKGDAQAALPIVQKLARDKFSGILLDKAALDGEARCALGQFAAGLKELEEVASMYSELRFEHDPLVARIRAVTGLCALAAGQHKRAADLAALAGRAFAAQPDVSPYFKAPLERLNVRLRAG